MDTRKSHAEFYLHLATSLLRCDPLDICTPRSLRKDLEVFASRTSQEGLAFLTKSLPRLGKALDQALLTGRLNVPQGFKIAHGTTNMPAMMQAYFSRVFSADGSLLEEACSASVKHIRQVCFHAYKLELPYSERQVNKVVDSFVTNEEALADLVIEDSAELDAAAYLIRDILSGFDPKEIVPSHGPGAVSTGEKLDQKWSFKRLIDSVHQVFPYYEYFVAGSAREIADRVKWYKGLQRVQHGVAKVVLVPKDSRGPRLISCEPLELQFIQQGVMRSLVPYLEKHPLTRGKVNFTDQEINRSLALIGSKTGSVATLDLKDASDLVSLQLVRKLFRETPKMLQAVEAVRSAATKLPNGRVLELRKHAPMGSALCFPVMALSCWALITAAVARATRQDGRLVGKSVYVYGDDIIVPTEWAQISMQALERHGLKVNRDKSCFTGDFRESCGMDAFKGVEVTPVRVKTPWTGRPSDGAAYSSYIQTANNLKAAGYLEAFEFLAERLRSTYGEIPYGTETAPFPCFLDVGAAQAIIRNRRRFRSRFNAELQRWEFLLKRVECKKLDSTLDGWHRLLRDLVAPPGDEPDVLVLRRSNRIKRRWAPVF